MEPTATPNLAAALLKAQMTSRGVTKDKTNDFHRYRYASTEALILESQECLHGAGLTLAPVGAELLPLTGSLGLIVPPEKGQAVSPDPLTVLVLRRRWRLLHTSGEAVEWGQDWPIVPERGRPFDKATAAADTASLGYTLRDLLLLARVEKGTELDDDERDEPRRGGPDRRDDAREEAATRKLAAPGDGAQRAHDPSWTNDHKRFMAKLGDLKPRVLYEDVAAWCEAQEWGRPSTWDQSSRDGLLHDLATKPDTRASLDAFLAQTKPHAAK